MIRLKNLIKKIGNNLSVPQTQKFFEALHIFSLAGMNYIDGLGEENSVKSLKFTADDNLIFFDVGANRGEYAQLLAASFKQAKIFSFEPSKKTFSLLKENVKNINNIVCENFGFDQEERETILYTNFAGSGLASVYQRQLSHLGVAMDQEETIQLKTIDSYCATNGITKIDLLKLDIEGNEFKALLGAKKMLEAGAINYIQFEFGGCNIDSKTFFKDFFLLLQDKYKIYRILKNGWQEIKQYQQNLEIFTIANLICEKK
jgi:FkbM family methyltransferase